MTHLLYRQVNAPGNEAVACLLLTAFSMGMFPRILVNWLLTHLLYLQVDAPDDEVVGRFLAHQIGVFLQVLKAVIVALHHAVLADLSFVFFPKLLLKQPRRQECSLLTCYPDISCPSLSNFSQMRNSFPSHAKQPPPSPHLLKEEPN